MQGYVERSEPFPQDALELWLILFAYQRGMLRQGVREAEEAHDPYLQGIRAAYNALRQALQNPPDDLSQEELLRQAVFVPHRPLKDPRDILMLDPACGSMHFGLYAFDLYEIIYAEAWEIEEQGGTDKFLRSPGLRPLHETYPDREAFLRDVPRLIIEHNIHGIDIDPRAVQIAGLSLWLRAQKGWGNTGVRQADRPQIRKSNIVCAEPMPGDRGMLDEFLATLDEARLEALLRDTVFLPATRSLRVTKAIADALLNLVRTVWEEMELAGEAGSLLKVEETLREAIAQARKVSAEKSPLFRVLEYDLGGDTAEKGLDFWNYAERLVLAALQDYAERSANGVGYRRRSFAGDATHGFAFIDLCQKRYDAVVMNPPFGSMPSSILEYATSRFPNSKNDIYTCFVDRNLTVVDATGFVGAITNRTGFFNTTQEKYRRNVLLQRSSGITCCDLGSGVLDAMVETAAYILAKRTSQNGSCFFNKKDSSSKEIDLGISIELLSQGEADETVFVVDASKFKSISGATFSYWVSSDLLSLFDKYYPIENEGDERTARSGLQTSDDYRFLRLWWEVPASGILDSASSEAPKFSSSSFPVWCSERTCEGRPWVRLAKGGEYMPFYSNLSLVINWGGKGRELKAWADPLYNWSGWSRIIKSTDYYFKPGVTWTQRTTSDFSARALPAGSIFGVKGPALFCPVNELALFLGYFNSAFFQQLIEVFLGAADSAARSYDNGIVQKLPDLTEKLTNDRESIFDGWATFLQYCAAEETCVDFVIPTKPLKPSLNEIIHKLDERLLAEPRAIAQLPKKQEVADAAASFLNGEPMYLLGQALGRWDIRYATGERQPPELPDPFDPLPVCPPGMLQNPYGLPATPEDVPASYPLRISWEGILTDDEGHPEDVEGRVREALHVIWQERAEAIEAEACQILGVSSLREYFRKPALFFADHLKRYSKSRRQAPIYWPLSTSSCSYTLWLYYHRLNDQTLFTCVNDFVDPKLKQVSGDLTRLRLKTRRSTADEKELERLSDLERELKDFRAELLRVAALIWKPNLNDGVEITAAPLWRLFQHKPWQKRLKETWGKLEAGEYDWAHLAYSIWPERVREKCKSDKSLAIAHGLEELYVESKTPGKKRKIKQQADMDEMFDE
jgi:hypothetical protein